MLYGICQCHAITNTNINTNTKYKYKYKYKIQIQIQTHLVPAPVVNALWQLPMSGLLHAQEEERVGIDGGKI